MVERRIGVSCVQRLISAAFTLLLSACGSPATNEETWDDDAPTVIETVPAAGDMAVDASLTEVTVTFSEAMEIGRWSWVTEQGHSVPNVSGIPFYADEMTAVLPVYLEPNTAYALWVNSPDDAALRKFASTDGIAAKAYRINFHTR
jgi:hypothetical protein